MDAYELIPAKVFFADALTELMEETGHNFNNYTKKELETTVAICTREFDIIWADFMAWIEHGDDEKAKTLDILKTALEMQHLLRIR